MTLNYEQLKKAHGLGLLDDTNIKHRTFAMTGTMSLPRKEMAALIRLLGGIAFEDGKMTWPNYLIVGNTGRHGETNKIKTARLKGVRIISEGDFVNLMTPGSEL